MKIANANIISSSEHQLIKEHTTRESLRVRKGDQLLQAEQTTSRTALGVELEAYSVNLSEAAPRSELPAGPFLPPDAGQSPASAVEAQDNDPEADEIGDPELRMLKLLFEKVFGVTLDVPAAPDSDDVKSPPPVAPDSAPDWGFEYQRHDQYLEAERTQVSLAGVVNTADGQSLEFALNLEMSRQFLSENNLTVRAGNVAVDPLVINFDGLAAQLTDRMFAFDLDSNGQLEDIAFVKPGSGFLALDRNGDGRVNDGSELFGPSSGNGFAELHALDEDGNRWLDENDDAFSQLQVWRKDEAGHDYLDSLTSVGVGAIYLQPTGSEFSVKDQQNELLGQVRSSSVYLTEAGDVGTVQQIDLAV